MMHTLLTELLTAVRSGRPVAYTALVETRGSTPQKAGAAMLVFPDGSQTGTLGGGCVEAEVKRRALRLLDDGRRELLTFQLDSDYGWDDGLICGGRMKMLVDPVRPGDALAYFERYEQLLAAGQGCTEAVRLETRGPGAEADRFLFDAFDRPATVRTAANADWDTAGAAPGGMDEVVAGLRPIRTRSRPYVAGGVSYLPQLERCRLVIVGAGHVGQKVAELAAEVDFDVWVLDDREQYCNAERFPRAVRRIVGPVEATLSGLEVDENTMCIIVTRGHNHDEEALLHLARQPARYLGMIGSRRKIRLIFEDLLRDGMPAAALERVHAPLGFDIGSQTVPEIAISIVAELVACRNLGRVPDRPRPESIMREIERGPAAG